MKEARLKGTRCVIPLVQSPQQAVVMEEQRVGVAMARNVLDLHLGSTFVKFHQAGHLRCVDFMLLYFSK